jgi:serine/threonine protein kinase
VPGPEPDEIELGEDDLIVSPVRRGRRLGRYILCYELAHGGMATVYLARASGAAGFQKLVAIKIIHPHLAKERDFVEMFLDEARIASGISHPNVCSVFDFGEADGTYFLAMEYLVGETAARLARTLAKNPPGVAPERVPVLVGHIFQQACEGLHAAHELKGEDGKHLAVVHRDMTPHNLFIGYDGSVRVVDFGVASAVGRMHQTSTGTLKGKFAYMSPEQAQQKTLDRRSDVWSLGVSLWEMLTRRRLFRRDGEFETLTAVVHGKIPVPSSVRPHIPTALDEIVMRALARDREQRFGTAREMGRELGRFVSAAGGASSADLADLMDGLYAEERAKQSALLDKARKLDPETPSTSKVVLAPVFATDGSGRTSMPSGTNADTNVPISHPRQWPKVVMALLVLGLVAIAAFALGSEPGSEPIAEVDDAISDPTPEVLPDPEPMPAEPEPAEPEPELVAPEPEPAEPEPVAESEPVEPGVEAPAVEPTMTRMNMRRAPMGDVVPVGRGRLTIATPPGWADIYVDGRHVGRSPTELRLDAGSRRIRLMPYGRGPQINRRVRIEADGSSRLVVRLED